MTKHKNKQGKRVKYYNTKKRKQELNKSLFYLTVSICILVGAVGLVIDDEVQAQNVPEATVEPVSEVVEIELMNDTIPIIEALKMVSDVPKLSVEKQIRLIADELCEGAEYCINDLVAIAWVETRFDCSRVGDGGNSYGCYQIHRGYHPDVSIEQAKDLKFAMNWTLNRMKHYGYPEFRSRSIMAHNGTPNIPATKKYLSKINNYIENYDY